MPTDVPGILITEDEEFVGMVSTRHARTMLALFHPEAQQFESGPLLQPMPVDPMAALSGILNLTDGKGFRASSRAVGTGNRPSG
jgi:hypothetical protein